MTGFRQVAPQARWPSGMARDAALLAKEPAELEDDHGLRFEEDVDDLGAYQLAAVELPDGSQVWLTRHRDAPVAGTVVHADAEADIARALERLLEALNLGPEAVLWRPEN